jgi:dTDP-4-amino-4,6-dideoxy-D-galactose acyltransferase
MREPDCQFLEWDSAFFGRRIARLKESELTPEELASVNQWCETHKIDCLYYLAEAADVESIHAVEEAGFRCVDIRVTLEKQMRDIQGTGGKEVVSAIRQSQPEDIPALRAIAKTGFRITRFYNDPNFPPELCDYLYETWIENSCLADREAVLVAVRATQPVGFVTCSLTDNASGIIGLIGVREDFQGKGLGTELLEASFSWFINQGVGCVKVVTQGQNLAALRLYQKRGFFINSMQLWFHKWYRQSAQK